MLKQALFILLVVLLGGVFIFSAYSKLYPIEPFELTFVDAGIANWRIAPFLARLFISLEFFTGILFLFNLRIRLAALLSILMLTLFSAYLIVFLFLHGNSGNCGCFGSYMPMSPVMGIVKNVVLFIPSIVLWKYYPGLDYKKLQKPLQYIFIPLCLALPHILNYVDLDYAEAYLNPPENHYKLELDSLYKHAEINNPPPALSQGKQLIAFMSLTCPHCRIAAKKIRIMKERNPNIPVYFVLNGDEDKLKPFFEDTGASAIPYCMLLGKSFVYLAGTNMPSIYLINNSMVEARIDYLSLDQTEIERWLGE